MPPKILLLVLVILITVSPAAAQSADLVKGIGIAGGFISGLGFSYRYFPVNGIGCQLSGVYTYAGSGDFLSLGGELLYIMHRNESTALYLLAGAGHFKEKSGSITDYYGFGLGYSICTLQRIWTSGDLVMAVSDGDFLPYPQISFHYLLK